MGRSGRAVAVVTLALLVGACSGAASQAPGDSGTGGAGASQSGGGGASTPAPGSSDVTADNAFGTASNNLDNLDSYKFDVELSSSSTSAVGSEGTTSFSGTVVHKPDQEQQLDEVEKDADGTTTDELHILIIGSNAWTKQTASDKYVAFPDAAVTGMIAGLSAFQPEKLFGTAFGTLGSDYHLVGTDSKNGVNSQHFHGDESIGTFFSALSGTTGTWSSDVWIATDGGYLVSSNVSASGADATSAGNFSIDVEITNVNDPANVLTPPS